MICKYLHALESDLYLYSIKGLRLTTDRKSLNRFYKFDVILMPYHMSRISQLCKSLDYKTYRLRLICEKL